MVKRPSEDSSDDGPGWMLMVEPAGTPPTGSRTETTRRPIGVSMLATTLVSATVVVTPVTGAITVASGGSGAGVCLSPPFEATIGTGRTTIVMVASVCKQASLVAVPVYS